MPWKGILSLLQAKLVTGSDKWAKNQITLRRISRPGRLHTTFSFQEFIAPHKLGPVTAICGRAVWLSGRYIFFYAKPRPGQVRAVAV